MKEVKQSELIAGELYCDMCRLNGLNAVVMRFVGEFGNVLHFKYVSGYSEYINEGDGIIRFPKYKKEPNWYWKLTKEMTDYYNNQELLVNKI